MTNKENREIVTSSSNSERTISTKILLLHSQHQDSNIFHLHVIRIWLMMQKKKKKSFHYNSIANFHKLPPSAFRLQLHHYTIKSRHKKISEQHLKLLDMGKLGILRGIFSLYFLPRSCIYFSSTYNTTKEIKRRLPSWIRKILCKSNK